MLVTESRSEIKFSRNKTSLEWFHCTTRWGQDKETWLASLGSGEWSDFKRSSGWYMAIWKHSGCNKNICGHIILLFGVQGYKVDSRLRLDMFEAKDKKIRTHPGLFTSWKTQKNVVFCLRIYFCTYWLWQKCEALGGIRDMWWYHKAIWEVRQELAGCDRQGSSS